MPNFYDTDFSIRKSGVPTAGTRFSSALDTDIRTLTFPDKDGTILLSTDLGTSVQAYDANTAKLNVNSTISGIWTFSTGPTLKVMGPDGYTIGLDVTTGLVADSSCTLRSGSVVVTTDTIAVAHGGTGATSAANARTNLGLGTIATQASNSVSITGGSISGITDLAVADGGTGASTLAGAGIVTAVGTPYNGTGLTGNLSAQTLLASSHAAGFYRVNVYMLCTTAGTTGDETYAFLGFNDGSATRAWRVAGNSYTGNYQGFLSLATTTASTTKLLAIHPFYSDGSVAITISTGSGTYTGSPQYTLRARLEYLGA
jgi:hypothetical protein